MLSRRFSDTGLYFFYGTMMNQETLQKALGLSEPPRLLPCKIIGYHCMFWGEYPALVDGKPGEPVHGMAYQIQSPEEDKQLRSFETDKYEITQCLVEFEDGKEVVANTFKWIGDLAKLKEGHVDPKA
ncbi:hypothetical protein F5884DRAFT_507470 [Xylogone sp. PMI_703]|nr:hypothetical protein F5884DRAFT_507470 [Xylogone sp. PMI_703]